MSSQQSRNFNTSPLDNIRVVLSRTSHPGNIGAAARAMKTMGLGALYLVTPKRFPDSEAEAMAANALDVVERAQVCAGLDEALQDTVLAAAFSARRRDLTPPLLDARQAAAQLLQQAQQHKVALVFGTEMSGLTTEEVARCQMLVHIPANPEYSSLNLASAVQVMCYELRMGLAGLESAPEPFHEPASLVDVELFFEHLEQTLVSTGFLDPAQPKKLMQRLRRLFARTRLEKAEVNILRGILKAIEK